MSANELSGGQIKGGQTELDVLSGGQGGKAQKKGIVDVVFLIDHSGSMGPAILNVMNNISTFIENLDPKLVEDWRIKINSYSDILEDPEGKGFVERGFVDNIEEVKNQLNEVLELVKEQLGGDEPETMLDAIYDTILNSFDKPYTERTRTVIVISDATTKPLTKLDLGDEANLEHLASQIKENHIYLYIYSPVDEKLNNLSTSPNAKGKIKYNPINPNGENPIQALKNLDMKDTLETLGKVVSRQSEIK